MTAAEPDKAPVSRDNALPHVAVLTLVGGVVGLAVVATTLALWEGRVVMLLLFLAYTLGAALRHKDVTVSSPVRLLFRRS